MKIIKQIINNFKQENSKEAESLKCNYRDNYYGDQLCKKRN
jgi:hypothetical protein